MVVGKVGILKLYVVYGEYVVKEGWVVDCVVVLGVGVVLSFVYVNWKLVNVFVKVVYEE